MKELAILEYMFLFDPSDTWQQGSRFERDLEDFFLASGFEAQIVDIRGGSSKRAFVLTRIATPPVALQENNPVNKPESRQIEFRRKSRSFGVPINARIHKKPLTPHIPFKQRVK